MEKKKLDKKVIGLTFNAVISRIDNITGEVLDTEEIHNLIVNNGLNAVRDLIGGFDSQGAFTHLAIGTGTTDPNATDTALETEVAREAATVTDLVNYQAKFEKVFTFSSGESYTITEVGILDGASGGVLLNRIEFTGKSVDVDTDLSVTVTITVA